MRFKGWGGTRSPKGGHGLESKMAIDLNMSHPSTQKRSVINLLFRTCMFYSTSFQDLQLTALPPNLFQCVMLAFAAMLRSCPRQLGEVHLHPSTWPTMACNQFRRWACNPFSLHSTPRKGFFLDSGCPIGIHSIVLHI